MGAGSGMTRLATALMAAAMLALPACSPAARETLPAVAPDAPRHRESGLPVIDLVVKSATAEHRFAVEMARTADEQSRGLMFRTAMGPDEGMIFPMDPPRFASFWMRNTVIPLDIIFIGPDGRILNIAASAQPYSEDHLRSVAPVKAVLELNGGRAAALGIAPGDTVTW